MTPPRAWPKPRPSTISPPDPQVARLLLRACLVLQEGLREAWERSRMLRSTFCPCSQALPHLSGGLHLPGLGGGAAGVRESHPPRPPGPPGTSPPCPAASALSGSPAAGRGPPGTQSPGPAKGMMAVSLRSCSPGAGGRGLSDTPHPSKPWPFLSLGLTGICFPCQVSGRQRGVWGPHLVHEDVEDTGGNR